jgi:hydrogenase maturation protease
VLILDVVRTEQRPAGTLLEWPLEQAGAARCLGGSHQVDLPSALALGRLLGWPVPESVALLVAEAEDLATLHEGLTPAVAKAVREAADMAVRWVEEGTLEEVAP